MDRINEVSAKATDHRASNYTWMAMIKRVFDEAEEKRRRGEARRRWTGDRWKGIFRVHHSKLRYSNSFLCVGSMDDWIDGGAWLMMKLCRRVVGVRAKLFNAPSIYGKIVFHKFYVLDV